MVAPTSRRGGDHARLDNTTPYLGFAEFGNQDAVLRAFHRTCRDIGTMTRDATQLLPEHIKRHRKLEDLHKRDTGRRLREAVALREHLQRTNDRHLEGLHKLANSMPFKMTKVDLSDLESLQIQIEEMQMRGLGSKKAASARAYIFFLEDTEKYLRLAQKKGQEEATLRPNATTTATQSAVDAEQITTTIEEPDERFSDDCVPAAASRIVTIAAIQQYWANAAPAPAAPSRDFTNAQLVLRDEAFRLDMQKVDSYDRPIPTHTLNSPCARERMIAKVNSDLARMRADPRHFFFNTGGRPWMSTAHSEAYEYFKWLRKAYQYDQVRVNSPGAAQELRCLRWFLPHDFGFDPSFEGARLTLKRKFTEHLIEGKERFKDYGPSSPEWQRLSDLDDWILLGIRYHFMQSTALPMPLRWDRWCAPGR